MKMPNENMKRQGEYVRLSESVVNSDRWSLLEEKIVSFEEDELLTPRQRKVLFTLFCALRTEYDAIIHDYYNNKYTSRSLLAWRARNLLEINTWCRFCCEDVKNADLLFKWAAEDQLELEAKMEKWAEATNHLATMSERIERVRQDVANQAEKHGVSDLAANYKSPLAAAETIGFEQDFKIHNKILSKFAHPTPMLLFSEELDDGMPKRAFYFFSQGCLFFYDAFFRLERLFVNIEMGELEIKSQNSK